MTKAADASIEAPRRVFVSFGKRPPRGVIWASGVTDYHARGKRFSRMLGAELDAKPARRDELREQLRAYLGGRRADGDWATTAAVDSHARIAATWPGPRTGCRGFNAPCVRARCGVALRRRRTATRHEA